jgi:predicted NBD/HSP70 family sugar kinase
MGLSDVRRHHLSVVLDQLARHGPRSRATLAQETGLTKATVSALVVELINRGLVEELETRSGRMGRPATDVGLSSGTVGAMGILIDADQVAACVMDLRGSISYRRSIQADFRSAGPAEVLARVRQVGTATMVDAREAGIHCAGVTVAVPGLVDPASGALFVAPNLHWLDVDLTDPVAALGLPRALPVQVENEANLGARAELRHGAGRELSSFVYLSGGVGVGAGIVTEGRLMRGSHGFAGEIGHLVVEPGGKQCACGARGCLETVVGEGRRASARRRIDALAAALHSVVQLFDPDAIVLGGSLAGEGPEFAGSLAERLQEETLGARWHPCQVRLSALGPDAALIGAATAALDQVLADPTLVPVAPSTQSA